MHLSTRKVRSKKTGAVSTYLVLEESYWDKKAKAGRNKLIQSFGNLDKIPPEQLEQLRRIYSSETQEKIRDGKLKKRVDAIISEAQEAVQESDSTSSSVPCAQLRYGHLLLKRIWNEDLGLTTKINYEQKHNTCISAYSLNDIAFYFSALKIIEPDSLLRGFVSQSRYILNPIYNISLDNIYEGIGQLGKLKDSLMKSIGNRLLKSTNKKPELLFYDCTNCYFETPFDDETQFRRAFIRRRRRILERKHFNEERIQAILSGAEFTRELEDAVAARANALLRKRGNSKEHRYDLPLVSIALVIDDRGLPLDFQVFNGNSSEFSTMRSSIHQLKQKYGISNAYIVADRGLNSASNLEMLKNEGLGFVVAQKISNQTKEIREQMLNPEGYKSLKDFEGDLSAETEIFHAAVAERLQHTSFKVCDHIKRVSKVVNDKVVVTEVKCKIMYTFNPKTRERDLKELEEDLAKARAAVQGGALMAGKNLSGGWRSLVLTQQESRKKKKEKDNYRAVTLNEKLIESRRQAAGYNAIVFSPSPEHEAKGLSIAEHEVLTTYHHLVRIEDCFRVMKHNFAIRPMFVRRPERIVGHCLMCVIALIMLRLIELKLAAKGVRMSATRICNALRDASLVALKTEPGKEILCSCRWYDVYPLSCNKLSKKQMVTGEQNSHRAIAGRAIREELHNGSDLENIARCLGLKMPGAFSTAKELFSRVKLRPSSDSLVIDPAIDDIMCGRIQAGGGKRPTEVLIFG